jgi:hypothetical protein
LQKTIDGLVGYEEAILSFGLCGNALLGITATTCDLIYPIVRIAFLAMLSEL